VRNKESVERKEMSNNYPVFCGFLKTIFLTAVTTASLMVFTDLTRGFSGP